MKYAIFLFVLMFEFTAFAQTSEIKPKTCTIFDLADHTSSCVVMKMRGNPGVWYPMERSEILRMAYLEVPELRIQLGKRQLQIDKALESADLLKASIIKKDETIVLLEKQLDEAHLAESKALQRLDSWYTNPLVWAGGGAIIGVIMTIALISP